MAVPQKISLFGGSFDPVHRQHLELAKAALAQFELDQVVFIPAKQSPFKTQAPASAQDRVAMLELAIADQPSFSVDQQELLRPAPSYTVDTVMSYRERYPSAQLFLIMGADQLPKFHKWHQAEKLRAEVTILIAPRKAHSIDNPPLNSRTLKLKPQADAATEIRHLLQTHGHTDTQTHEQTHQLPTTAITAKLHGLLKPQILAYITEHHLYEK